MNILEEEYSNLEEEIVLGSTADGTPKVEEFFRIFSELAADNGDCPDLTYCPASITGGLRADGYAFDISEKSDEASGDLYIGICAYFQDKSLPTINASDIEKIIAEAVFPSPPSMAAPSWLQRTPNWPQVLARDLHAKIHSATYCVHRILAKSG